MADSPIIYLHVGHGKAASSTIQGFLQSNADEIRRQGLLIADVDLEFPQTGPVRGYPFVVLRDWIEDAEDGAAKFSDALRRVDELCRAGGFRGAVISSEVFSSPLAAKQIGEAAEGLPIHAIYYVRRQGQWLESAWKQLGLKDGTSLDEFVEQGIQLGKPGFLRSALAWRETANQLTVCPIEGVDDVQEHFAGWCGLDFDRLKPVERSNRTFDWSLLDLMSRNPFLFNDCNDNRVFNFLEAILPEDTPREGHGMMTAEQAGRVWSACHEENRGLRREFFPGLPECDWDRPPVSEAEFGRAEQFGSVDSVFRNLAIQLTILRNLHEQFAAGGKVDDRLAALDERGDRLGESITRRFNRLRSRLEREESRRRALEDRLERLESRSLLRLVSAPFANLKAWWRRRTGMTQQDAEIGMEDS